MPKRVAVENSVRFGIHGVVHKIWWISLCRRTRCTVLYVWQEDKVHACSHVHPKCHQLQNHENAQPACGAKFSKMKVSFGHDNRNLRDKSIFSVYQNDGAPNEGKNKTVNLTPITIWILEARAFSRDVQSVNPLSNSLPFSFQNSKFVTSQTKQSTMSRNWISLNGDISAYFKRKRA